MGPVYIFVLPVMEKNDKSQDIFFQNSVIYFDLNGLKLYIIMPFEHNFFFCAYFKNTEAMECIFTNVQLHQYKINMGK